MSGSVNAGICICNTGVSGDNSDPANDPAITGSELANYASCSSIANEDPSSPCMTSEYGVIGGYTGAGANVYCWCPCAAGYYRDITRMYNDAAINCQPCPSGMTSAPGGYLDGSSYSDPCVTNYVDPFAAAAAATSSMLYVYLGIPVALILLGAAYWFYGRKNHDGKVYADTAEAAAAAAAAAAAEEHARQATAISQQTAAAAKAAKAKADKEILELKSQLARSGTTNSNDAVGSCSAMSPAQLKDAGFKHVMLSYSWAQKPLVLSLQIHLEEQGFSVWRDEVGSKVVPSLGSFDSPPMGMAEAINASHHVIVLLSHEYEKSANCNKEFDYASTLQDKKHTKILYVMLDKSWTPHSQPEMTGKFAFAIGAEFYFSCFDNEPTTIANTAHQLGEKMGSKHMWAAQELFLHKPKEEV